MAPREWVAQTARRRRRDDDDQNNLLVELFVEELPPKALKKLGDAFAGVHARAA